ncbi:MAG: GFA family protein [Candidatus Binatus sp.]
MIESSCVCGAVRLAIARAPDEVLDCNCSICRRYGVLWAYYSLKDVIVPSGLTDTYLRGAKHTAFHRCKVCGCVTHWSPTDQRDRMGVNARLMAPEILSQVRVRHLDGADTWKYLD